MVFKQISFLVAIGLNLVWINVSTIIRYFLFVRPMMREAYPTIPDVAGMNLPVFFAWGVWAAIPVLSIAAVAWLSMKHFGDGVLVVLASGTVAWLVVYANLWGANFLMNLAPPGLVAIVLILTWIEMAVGALLVRWAMRQ